MATARDWLEWLLAVHKQRQEFIRGLLVDTQREQSGLRVSQDELDTFIREHGEATQWLMLEGKRRGFSDSIRLFSNTTDDIEHALASST